MATNDDDYHSVPRDVLTAIGKLGVAGGVLEGAAHMLLISLGGDPGRGAFSATVRCIRNVAVRAPAEVDAHGLLGWCREAEHAMAERNRVLHSMFVSVCVEDESTGESRWKPIAMHLRTGDRTRMDDPAPFLREARRVSHLAEEALKYVSTASVGDRMWRPPIVPAGTPPGAVPELPES